MKLTGFILAALFLPAAALAAHTDFDTAARAYRARHYATAYKEFLAMAKAGNPRAQTVVALMNKFGESVEPSDTVAFEWYLKAAKQGYGPALYQVGVMYAEGKGVEQDHKKAIEWLRRAAKVGFKRALPKLAALGETRPRSKPADADRRAWNLRLPNSIRDRRMPADKLDPEANYRVELGSMSTREGAGRLWDALVKRAPQLLDDTEPVIRLARHSDRRMYRVQTGPFNGLAAALDFCKQLQRTVQTVCQPVTD